jgi:hypothetical protein
MMIGKVYYSSFCCDNGPIGRSHGKTTTRLVVVRSGRIAHWGLRERLDHCRIWRLWRVGCDGRRRRIGRDRWDGRRDLGRLRGNRRRSWLGGLQWIGRFQWIGRLQWIERLQRIERLRWFGRIGRIGRQS